MVSVRTLLSARGTRLFAVALFGLYVGVVVVRMAVAEMPDNYLTPLLDYGSFMHAAESLANGLDPYSYHPGIAPPPSAPYGINLNPPVSLIPFTVLSGLLDPAMGRLVVQVASAVGLLGMLAVLARRYPENGGAFTLIALVWVSHIGGTIWWGQIYVLLGICSLVGVLALERRRWLPAGIAFGVLVAMKPPFLLVPLLLIVSGHRREGAATLGVAGCLSLAPALLWGTDIYRQWYELSSSLGAIHYEGWPRGSMSLASASFVLLGTNLPGIVLSGIIVAAFATWICRTRARFSATDIAAYGLLVAMIASPVTWPGYAPIIIPALMARPFNRGTWVGIVMLWFAGGIGMLILLAAHVRQDLRRFALDVAASPPSTLPISLPPSARTQAEDVEPGASRTGAAA